MSTFATYDHLPAPIREAFAELEDMLGDLDGKTIATPADENTFIDEGTIVMDDAVKAFNTLVSALSPPEPTEDAVLDLIRSCWGDQKMRDALTVTKWKDGIDIQLPSHSLMQFVAAIRAMPLQDRAAGHGDCRNGNTLDGWRFDIENMPKEGRFEVLSAQPEVFRHLPNEDWVIIPQNGRMFKPYAWRPAMVAEQGTK